MDKVTVGDIDICYRIEGEGHPLVMIIGLTANMDWWDPELIDKLSKRYRILLFDNRGAGRSGSSDGDYSMRQFADDTAGLMEAVGFDLAHVLGVSMGGMIAQELVLDYPERVDRLVLCATNCGGRESVLPDREVLTKLVDRTGTQDRLVRRFLSLMFPEEWLKENEAYFEDFKQRYLAAPATDENAAKQFMATARSSTCDRLPAIDKPTLVACGSEDVLIPAENSRILAKRIPGARLIEFEGAGHGFMNQCRKEFVESLTGFLG